MANASAQYPGIGFARVAVFDSVEAALPDWARLEVVAPASVYQTWRWVQAWLATIGAAQGIQPMIVVAYDVAGQPVMLLALGVRRFKGFSIARFAGGGDANFTMPLCQSGVAFSPGDLRVLLAQAAGLAKLQPDIFILTNQVESWEGFTNPFAALPRQPSPSFGYKSALMTDGEAFLKSRLSGDARKKLNYKLRKLTAKGEVKLLAPQDLADPSAVIAAFQAQKAARFRALGIAVNADPQAEAAFLHQASLAQGGKAAMEWFALACGGEIIAAFAGGEHRGRLHGMVTSFALAPDIAIASPGDQLMQRLCVHACQRGLHTFDLGTGEARYKSTWCSEAEPLFDCLIPTSAQGRLYGAVETARLADKRRIKQTPWLWTMVLRARKRKAG